MMIALSTLKGESASLPSVLIAPFETMPFSVSDLSAAFALPSEMPDLLAISRWLMDGVPLRATSTLNSFLDSKGFSPLVCSI